MVRIAFGIAYEGTAYYGWQRQDDPQLPTLQACVEQAFSKVADQPVNVICAGRTDRGVHALGLIAHFDTEVMRTERAWVLGANTYLPKDIRVHWAREVSDEFHARYAALARRYRYVVYNRPIKPALLRNQVTTYYQLLNERAMQEAAHYLMGEHDFTSYRTVQCQAKSPVRTVTRLDITRHQDFIFIDIQANGFLHHMVRNIAGVLMTIGSGERPAVWAKEILEAKDRTQGDVTAPASGLYFMAAVYPEKFAIPDKPEPMFMIG